MRLAERHREFDILRQLFARSLQTRGQVALISGGVAYGKTALLNSFVDYAIESGAVLLTAAASPTEQSVRLGVMGQLFEGVSLPVSVRNRASELLTYYGLAGDDTDPDVVSVDEPDLPTMHGLCRAIFALAREQPVVLVVDDVQYIDSHSLETLLYLQRRMRLSRVLMILSEWAPPRSTRPPLHIEFARMPNFTRLNLNLLTRAGVAEVLAHDPEVAPSEQLTTGIHEVSGGNPLLVHALIEDSVAAERQGANDREIQLVVGQSFQEAVRACLHRWEPRLLHVAQGVALLDDFSEPHILARLLHLTTDSAAQVIDVLAMTGLLANGRFRHLVARAAVLDSIPADALAAMHMRAATLLRERATSPIVVAKHLVSAGETDEPWVACVLREAADEALVGDEITMAVDFLNLARQACTDERERAHITMRLAHVEWRISPAMSNEHIVRLRSAVREGHLNGNRATVFIKYLLWHGQADEAARTLTMMLDSATAEYPRLATELRLHYHLLAYSHPTAFPQAKERMASADELERLVMLGAPWIRGTASLASVLSYGPSESAISGAEHVLQSTVLTDETLDLLLIALLALIYADCPDRAAPWCENLLEEAGNRNANTWLALLSNVRADIALRQGNLPLAATCATTALTNMPAQNWGVGIGGPLSTLILATTRMGEFDEAAKLLKRAVPATMFQTWFAPQYLHARGQYFLYTNNVMAAVGDFQQCGALMTQWSIDHPAIAPWRSDLALAYLELGKHEEARKLVGDQLACTRIGARVKGISLRILAATRKPDNRLQILSEALSLQHATGDVVEQAMTLAELSWARQERGEVDAARTLTERALGIAKGCRAMTLARKLLSGSRALGIEEPPANTDTEGPPTLSNAEWRVASLAALGHTNRAISRKLSITVSTVEQHLTRVYRKLNVNRRADLAAELPMQHKPWISESADDDGPAMPALSTYG